jgi:hypothetical protein
MAGPRKAAVPPEPTHHDVRETTFRLGSQVGTNFIATSNDRDAPSVLLINTIRQTSRKRPSSVVRLGQSGITGLERMEAAGSQLDPSTSPGCRTRDKSPPLHKMLGGTRPSTPLTSKPPKAHRQTRSTMAQRPASQLRGSLFFHQTQPGTARRPANNFRSEHNMPLPGLGLPSEQIVQWAGLPSA